VLKVAEVFHSVQGEGFFTGTPAAFIRLHGCGVGCPWCDTPYTWKQAPRPVTFEELIQAPPESALVAEVTPDVLADWTGYRPGRHVVVTGGEPFEQDLNALLTGLNADGCYVQIETSGTVGVPETTLVQTDWITLSPKVGMPGGRQVDRRLLDVADEIKMPVGRDRDLAALLDLLGQRQGDPVPVWLQPLSQSPAATRLCIEAAAAHGWRVSLQTHKLAGLR
jgi:7-carboxy-7-deazaguanine synthase